jgi:hypothetical protein
MRQSEAASFSGGHVVKFSCDEWKKCNFLLLKNIFFVINAKGDLYGFRSQ